MRERQCVAVINPLKKTQEGICQITTARGRAPDVFAMDQDIDTSRERLTGTLDKMDDGTEVVVVGGDGALWLAANAIYTVLSGGKQLILSMIPNGTENDGSRAINGPGPVDYRDAGRCDHDSSCGHLEPFYPIEIQADGRQEIAMTNHFQGLMAAAAHDASGETVRRTFNWMGGRHMVGRIAVGTGLYVRNGLQRLPSHTIQLGDRQRRPGKKWATGLQIFNGRTAGTWPVALGAHRDPENVYVLYNRVLEPLSAARLGVQLVAGGRVDVPVLGRLVGELGLEPHAQVTVHYEEPVRRVQSDGEVRPPVSEVTVRKGKQLVVVNLGAERMAA